jgi:hypothetical protein
MRGVIIEGVTASGKSSLFRLLQGRLFLERPSNTKLFLSEHYTERLLEDSKAKRTLTYDTCLAHIKEITKTLAHLASWKATSKFGSVAGNAEIFVLVERFLGAHFANLQLADNAPLPDAILAAAIDIYEVLSEMGISVVLLTVRADRLSAALEDTRIRRNRAWNEYLESIGDSQAVSAYFARWQAKLIAFYETLSSSARIDVQHFRTSTVSLDEICGSIMAALTG